MLYSSTLFIYNCFTAFFVNHFLRFVRVRQEDQTLMHCWCLLVHSSSQKSLCFHSLSSHPFIMLPSSIFPLTSSLVSRQEDGHGKSLFGPETKQEKFPHPSKELKIFDNVLGPGSDQRERRQL